MLGQSGGTWPACCHWPNTGRVHARCPIMSVLTQSYQCGTWFVCSIVRELAVSNLGQPLFCLSITWSRCRNAYRDLWIMTIKYDQLSTSTVFIATVFMSGPLDNVENCLIMCSCYWNSSQRSHLSLVNLLQLKITSSKGVPWSFARHAMWDNQAAIIPWCSEPLFRTSQNLPYVQ